ncbi:MAG TPA: ribosome maturation factor RimM [Gammaproteobacteria bacterium]|nr:ribosome maturation factor RimM [Gammaproteobacteria bacterium]
MAEDSERVIIGRVVGVYGIKGWLKILSYTRPRENIFTYSPWHLRSDDNTERVFELRDGCQQGKGLIAVLDGITDRDQASNLVNTDIAIGRAQLHEPGPGEYYWHDLLGAEVFNQHAELLGRVTEILETGGNDVLVVEGDDRHLVPFIEPDYISEVDTVRRIIRVVWDI